MCYAAEVTKEMLANYNYANSTIASAMLSSDYLNWLRIPRRVTCEP